MRYVDFLNDPVWENEVNVIYKFTNTLNNKIYIGQTSTSLRKRVINHLTKSRKWTKSRKGYFQHALFKYGIENFNIDVLERCETKELLNEREKYWISYYNSNNKLFGYNLTPGGEGNSDPEFCKRNIERLIQVNTGSHKSEDTKKLLSNIHKELWNNQDFRDKHIENAKMLSKITSKKVLQLDYNYNIIGSYNSIREVQKLLYNNLRSNLARNLANNSTRGFYKNGYIWMKESDYLKRK